MKLDNPQLPWANKDVRRALNMAIDRQAIVNGLYKGHAKVLPPLLGDYPEHASYQVPFKDLAQSTREIFEYHPDTAKQLMAAAGYPNGFKATVLTQASDVDNLAIVQDYWKKNLNVELTLDIREAAAFGTALGQRAHKEMATNAYSSLATVGTFYLWRTDRNPDALNDPKASDMVKRYGELWADPAKQFAMIKESSPYLVDQAWYIFWPVPNLYIFWQPWVKNFYGSAINPDREFAHVWIDQNLKKTMSKN